MAWPKNIILVGFMASGKSHVGRILAQRTGRPLADSDELIVARAGKSVERIFAEDGEAAFRTLERAVISELCAGSGRIISAGGGAFVDPDNRRTMRAGGRVFCLHARPETIYKRLAATNPGSDIPAPDNPESSNPESEPDNPEPDNPEPDNPESADDNPGAAPVRPLLAGDNPLERIRELLAQRAPAYNQAHHRIDTDTLAPEQVAERVLETLAYGEMGR